MTYKTIWDPGQEHVHILPKLGTISDKGKIMQCECGRYYYISWMSGYTGMGRVHVYYSPVRWYHFRMQKKISAYILAEAEERIRKDLERIDNRPPDD